MKELKYKKRVTNPLNEAVEARCNMDEPEAPIETKGAVSVTYATALNDHKKRMEKIKDDFKEADKNAESFVEETDNRDLKVKGTADQKKMKLSESLFDESFFTPEKLYKHAEELADGISEFLDRTSKLDNLDDYLDEDDLDHIGKAMDALNDFAVAYAHVTDNEDVFENLDEETKKRTRSPNEEKYGIDYSDTDLWLQVYDELSADISDEGEGGQVHRHVKGKKGERYEEVYPVGDDALQVYGTSPEDFEFAKKVADFYGVIAEEPKEDKNKRTNSYYRWSMIIRIPEGSEPKEFNDKV